MIEDIDPVLEAFKVIRSIRKNAGSKAEDYVISEEEALAMNLLAYSAGLGVLEPDEIKEWNSFLAQYDSELN